MTVKPIILCGGSGTRLWPESRKSMPKQFIPLFDNKSLLDLTLERILIIKEKKKPIIVTSKDYGFFVKASLEKYNLEADIILEPESKNTTAAIYFAAKTSNIDDTLLIMPSDHLIPAKNEFINNIIEIQKLTNFDEWITLGVKPLMPSEAYGYIKTLSQKDNELLNVLDFLEKPNKDLAKEMLKKGNYFWNAGIFMGKASMILNSIYKYANDISLKCEDTFNMKSFIKNENEIHFDPKTFNTIPSQSIDIAVMEKEKNIKLFPLKCEWSDVGSWDAIANINNLNLKSNTISIDSKNNFIKSEKRLIATIGVQDLIIVDSDNATLIVKKNETEKVKDLVNNLLENNKMEAKEHTFENRPWGKFETLLDTNLCKVKRIEVLSNKRLSLQYHNFRSEHWLVVVGNATVYLNGKILKLSPGMSIDIPVKSHHYIHNKTKVSLVIIETQLGTYFGEDDIIRLDDPFDR